MAALKATACFMAAARLAHITLLDNTHHLLGLYSIKRAATPQQQLRISQGLQNAIAAKIICYTKFLSTSKELLQSKMQNAKMRKIVQDLRTQLQQFVELNIDALVAENNALRAAVLRTNPPVLRQPE